MTIFISVPSLLLTLCTLLLPSYLVTSQSSSANPISSPGNIFGVDYGYVCTGYAANNIDSFIARRMIKQFCSTHKVGYPYIVNETLGGQNLTPAVDIDNIGLWMTFSPNTYPPTYDSYNTSDQTPLNGTCRTDAENCEQRFNDVITSCE